MQVVAFVCPLILGLESCILEAWQLVGLDVRGYNAAVKNLDF